MAEGKDSFKMYLQFMVLFTSLSDEKAGKLIKQCFRYCNDENPSDPEDDMVNYGFQVLKASFKKDLENWKETCKKNSENQKKRWKKEEEKIDTAEYERIQPNTNCTDKIREDKIREDKIREDKDINLKESVKEKADDESPTSTPTPSNEIKPSKEQKHRYGEYGQVLLTNSEYERLCEKYGEGYIIQVIQALDESKKMTGNKNKWKDDNLVIQKAIREEWSMLKNIDPYKTPKSMKEEKENEEMLNQKVDLSFLD